MQDEQVDLDLAEALAKMHIHETHHITRISNALWVIRVPGGWIYKWQAPNGTPTSQFVPLPRFLEKNV